MIELMVGFDRLMKGIFWTAVKLLLMAPVIVIGYVAFHLFYG